MTSFPPRWFTRPAWKTWYRLQRIAIRECNKATMDMLLFGTGCVMVDPSLPDLIQHVPLEELRL
jgi:hypothetical protein